MFFATTAPAVLRRNAFAVGPRQLDRALERFLDNTCTASSNAAAQLTQDDTHYTLTLDVPGIAKEQLTIAIEGHHVRVSTVEDAPRRYQAVYELPIEIDSAASRAKLANGVLTLNLAKKLPVSNVTHIAVE